jgi:uncharacterized OB-fold protein
MEAIAKPVPRVTPELAPFFAAAKEHRLVVQRCSGCGLLRFPPRELCSRCWSRDAAWVPVSGRGEVYSFYWMHQIYHPGFAAEVPYAVVTIALDEGPHVVSNVIGCSRAELRIGMPVEVTFEDASAEVTLPKFRPRA